MKSLRKSRNFIPAFGVLLVFCFSAMASLVDSEQFRERFHERKSLRFIDREEEEEEREREHERDEEGPSDPDGALRFRRLQLQDQRGYIPLDGLEKARQHVKLMKAAQQERIKTGIKIESAGIKPDSWIWLGPGNIGGRIRSIVVHPTQPNRMWVGSVGGGMWSTTNSGGFWAPVNDFLANLAVTAMIISPTNPNVMYAGTGEGFGNTDAIQGAGIFKSTDGGASWVLLTSTNPAGGSPPGCGTIGAAPCPAFWTFVNRLALSPDGLTLLAATGGPAAAGGLARSTDGGTSWTVRATNQQFDVDFQPGNSTRAIAGGEGGASLSTDSGQTWNAVTFNPPIAAQPAPPTRSFQRRIEVAFAPSVPGIVYAVVNQHQGGGNYEGDVYRSVNGGQSFTRVNSGTSFFLGGGGNQGWYDNVVWVSPLNSTFVIVGGISLWRSTDSGNTFAQISNGGGNSAHSDHHVIVAHPGFDNNNNTQVFFGNDGGIYRADDVNAAVPLGGTTINFTELNNGLGITQFYGAAGNVNSGVIVGGAQDNGTLAGRKGGFHTEDWTAMAGNDGGSCAADQTNSNYFYGESQRLQINRSSDGGASAVSIASGIADAGTLNTNFIAPFVLDPNDPNTILAGGLSLWRSNDVRTAPANPTWSSVPKPNGANSLISAITISPGGSNFVVVGHNNGDIYRTFNGTAGSPSWLQINTPTAANHFVTRLAIDNARTPNWIYATFGGFTTDNVFRTTDLGATWTDITGTGLTGLPNVPVRSLVYHPINHNLLYVGTEIGIFTSDDGGATWEPVQNGPANVSVDELFWMGNDLIAATHGRGLYQASGGTYVDCNYLGFENGSILQPYRTITRAKDNVSNYQIIWIRPCNYNERIVFNKRMELRNFGGGVIIGKP